MDGISGIASQFMDFVGFGKKRSHRAHHKIKRIEFTDCATGSELYSHSDIALPDGYVSGKEVVKEWIDKEHGFSQESSHHHLTPPLEVENYVVISSPSSSDAKGDPSSQAPHVDHKQEYQWEDFPCDVEVDEFNVSGTGPHAFRDNLQDYRNRSRDQRTSTTGLQVGSTFHPISSRASSPETDEADEDVEYRPLLQKEEHSPELPLEFHEDPFLNETRLGLHQVPFEPRSDRHLFKANETYRQAHSWTRSPELYQGAGHTVECHEEPVPPHHPFHDDWTYPGVCQQHSQTPTHNPVVPIIVEPAQTGHASVESKQACNLYGEIFCETGDYHPIHNVETYPADFPTTSHSIPEDEIKVNIHMKSHPVLLEEPFIPAEKDFDEKKKYDFELITASALVVDESRTIRCLCLEDKALSPVYCPYHGGGTSVCRKTQDTPDHSVYHHVQEIQPRFHQKEVAPSSTLIKDQTTSLLAVRLDESATIGCLCMQDKAISPVSCPYHDAGPTVVNYQTHNTPDLTVFHHVQEIQPRSYQKEVVPSSTLIEDRTTSSTALLLDESPTIRCLCLQDRGILPVYCPYHDGEPTVVDHQEKDAPDPSVVHDVQEIQPRFHQGAPSFSVIEDRTTFSSGVLLDESPTIRCLCLQDKGISELYCPYHDGGPTVVHHKTQNTPDPKVFLHVRKIQPMSDQREVVPSSTLIKDRTTFSSGVLLDESPTIRCLCMQDKAISPVSCPYHDGEPTVVNHQTPDIADSSMFHYEPERDTSPRLHQTQDIQSSTLTEDRTCFVEEVHLKMDVSTSTEYVHFSTDHHEMHNAATCTDYHVMLDETTLTEGCLMCDAETKTDNPRVCDVSVSTECCPVLDAATSMHSLVDTCDTDTSTDCHHVTTSTFCYMVGDEEIPTHCHLNQHTFPDTKEAGTSMDCQVQDEATATSDLQMLYLRDADSNTHYPHVQDAITNTYFRHSYHMQDAHTSTHLHYRDAHTNTYHRYMCDAHTNTYHCRVRDSYTNTYRQYVRNAWTNTPIQLVHDAESNTQRPFMHDADTNTHYSHVQDADTNTHSPHVQDAYTNTDAQLQSHNMHDAETSTCCNLIGEEELYMFCPLMENEGVEVICQHTSIQELEKSIVFYEANDSESATEFYHLQEPVAFIEQDEPPPRFIDQETSTDDLEECPQKLEAGNFDFDPRDGRRMRACINSCNEKGEHMCIYKELSPHCPIRRDEHQDHHRFISRTSSMPLMRRRAEVLLRSFQHVGGEWYSAVRVSEQLSEETIVGCKSYFRVFQLLKGLKDVLKITIHQFVPFVV